MLLHESRRNARSTPEGDLILLEDQDRTLWDRECIAEGLALVRMTLTSRRWGPYTLQAAISATHAAASSVANTDWQQVVQLYEMLMQIAPSPVVNINLAAAIAMRDGPAAGLARMDAIMAEDHLLDYHLAHAARADLCRRLGRFSEARISYLRAMELAQQEPERRFLQRQLSELPA